MKRWILIDDEDIVKIKKSQYSDKLAKSLDLNLTLESIGFYKNYHGDFLREDNQKLEEITFTVEKIYDIENDMDINTPCIEYFIDDEIAPVPTSLLIPIANEMLKREYHEEE